MTACITCSTIDLSQPLLQGNQCDKDVEQIELDAPLLQHSQPTEQGRDASERRENGPVEHSVVHLGREVPRPSEHATLPPPALSLERGSKGGVGFRDPYLPNQHPTEQRDQHLSERRRRVLHGWRRCRIPA